MFSGEGFDIFVSARQLYCKSSYRRDCKDCSVSIPLTKNIEKGLPHIIPRVSMSRRCLH